jgi:hypothetical protein
MMQGEGWHSREIKLKELTHEEGHIALREWNYQWSHMQPYVGWALLFASVSFLQGYIRWDPFVLWAQTLEMSLLSLCWHNKALLPAKLPQHPVCQLETPATVCVCMCACSALQFSLGRFIMKLLKA